MNENRCHVLINFVYNQIKKTMKIMKNLDKKDILTVLKGLKIQKKTFLYDINCI